MSYNLLDNVSTPDGPALVVGLPEHEMIEVKYPASGKLKIWNEGDLSPLQEPVPVKDDVPRGRDGRRLTGVALRNYRAKQETQSS